MIEGDFQFIRDWIYAPFLAAIGGVASFFYSLLKKTNANVKENNDDIEALNEKQGRLDERVKNLEKKE